MTRRKLIRCSLVLSLLSSPVVFAKMPETAQPSEAAMHGDMHKDAMQAQGMATCASKLIGMNIYNDQGESLGEINELVLNGGESRISYAVLSFGGWMGIRDKLFAIPWSQFEHRGTDNKLYLNVKKDDLRTPPASTRTSGRRTPIRLYGRV